MKNFKYLSLLFIFGIGSINIAQAQQSEEDIRNLLEARDAEIKELMGPKGSEYSDKQRSQLKEIINGIIDFEAMASEALADTYNSISDEQRNEFVDLFSTIVRDQSLNKLDIYRADVTYTNIDVNGEQVRVETLAQLDDVRTPVSYEMVFENDEWVITDMEIDDVSTAGSYHRQFQRIINQKGFDALMESLRKRASRA
ncbi:MAG: ABC transporter substrate-binding protein [Balneolaceae bacterium]